MCVLQNKNVTSYGNFLLNDPRINAKIYSDFNENFRLICFYVLYAFLELAQELFLFIVLVKPKLQCSNVH